MLQASLPPNTNRITRPQFVESILRSCVFTYKPKTLALEEVKKGKESKEEIQMVFPIFEEACKRMIPSKRLHFS